MAAHLEVVHPDLQAANRTGSPATSTRTDMRERVQCPETGQINHLSPEWAARVRAGGPPPPSTGTSTSRRVARPRRAPAGYRDVAARTMQGEAAAARAAAGRALVEQALASAPVHPAARAAARRTPEPPETV